MLRAVVSKSSRLPALLPALSRAHCQVPCGIFDDPVRVTQLKEDAATVRKAMVQINDLSGAGTALALNQATRWIITKEDHAKSIISTVSEYMLCQRVKKVRVPLLARPSSPLGAPLAEHRPTAHSPPGGPLLTPDALPPRSRDDLRSSSRTRPTTCRRSPRTTRCWPPRSRRSRWSTRRRATRSTTPSRTWARCTPSDDRACLCL